MPPKFSSQDYERRDLAILRHAAEYEVVLNAVVSVLFFCGKQAGHVIRRLCDLGDVELFARSLPGSISYARLTKSGCARIGISDKNARPLSGHALTQAIAVLVYCVLGTYRRVRLTPSDMKNLLGSEAPHANITHVLVSKEEFGHFAVLRVVFAGGSIQETKKQIAKLIDNSQTNAALRDAMSGTPSYGFLLLCSTETRKAAVEAAFVKTDLGEQALLVFGVGPGVDELPAYLKSLKGGRP